MMSQGSDVRKDLRASTLDGCAYSVMLGVGESQLRAFALAVGHSAVASGLLSTIPQLSGAILQLLAPRIVRWSGTRKRAVFLCAAAQGVAFLPLVVGAAVGYVPFVWLLVIASVYWGAGLAASPPWNSWMAQLVPRKIRSNYFAYRTRYMQFSVFASLMAGGAILSWFQQQQEPLRGFVIIFFLAFLARMVSVYFLIQKRELDQPYRKQELVRFSPLEFIRRPKSRAMPVIIYILVLQCTAQIGAPYFDPYMLKQLNLSYVYYTMLLCAAFLGRVLMLPLAGWLGTYLGVRSLLWIGGLAVAPMAGLWLISDNIIYLTVIQFAAGAAWATYDLATLLILFETLDDHERTEAMTLYNFANAAAVVAGSLIGGWILTVTGGDKFAFHLLFVISTVGRFLAVPLLLQIADVPRIHIPAAFRIMSVRPAAGAIERPVMSSFAAPEELGSVGSDVSASEAADDGADPIA